MKEHKLPDFSKMTLEEIGDFWDTHDSAEYWDEMEEVEVTFKRPKEKIVSMRLSSEDLEEIKRRARNLGLGHTTLIRSWIKEKLQAVP